MTEKDRTTRLVQFANPYKEKDMGWDIEGEEQCSDLIELQISIAAEVMLMRQQLDALGHPMDWGKKKEAHVKKKILGSREWEHATRELLQKLLPGQDISQELLQKLNMPWWANAQLNLTKIVTRGEGSRWQFNDRIEIHHTFALNHSYITQLSPFEIGLKKDPSTSVGGIVLSSDGKIPFGLRGGKRHADTYMLVPAGYVDLARGNRHPLVANWYYELADELGITEDSVEELQYDGIVGQDVMGAPGNVIALFRAKAGIDFQEILSKHQSSAAADRSEHKEIIPLTKGKIIQWIERQKPYDYRAENPKNPVQTTEANKGAILPQAMAPFLAFAQRTGENISHFMSQQPQKMTIETAPQGWGEDMDTFIR